MTDGNMATISPVSEGEMDQIQSLFKKAADTLVAYASISGQVEKLQAQVNDLANQVTRYRNHIDTQDDAMYRLRQEREELTKAKNDAIHEAEVARQQYEVDKQENERLTVKVQNLQDQVAKLMKDRDDAEFKALELEDKLKTANNDLGKVREFARSILPEVPIVKDMPVSPPPVSNPPPAVDITEWRPPYRDSADETEHKETEVPLDPWSSAQRATS